MELAKEGTEHEKPLRTCGKKRSSWCLGRVSGQEQAGKSGFNSGHLHLRGNCCAKSLWDLGRNRKMKAPELCSVWFEGRERNLLKETQNNPKTPRFFQVFYGVEAVE